MNEVSATIGATYGELFAYLSQNEIIPIGMPFNWWISSPFLTFVRLSLKDSGCCVVVNTSPNTTPLASSNTINYLYFQFQLID